MQVEILGLSIPTFKLFFVKLLHIKCAMSVKANGLSISKGRVIFNIMSK